MLATSKEEDPFSLERKERRRRGHSSLPARRGKKEAFEFFFAPEKKKLTHSLLLPSSLFFSSSSTRHSHQVNASPAIKRRAFWNSDYSDYPPESDYATLGREYDAQNAAVVDAYSRLLQETTVRSAWKRPGCNARSCSPYTEGACSPESKECKTEAEMARKVGFVPLFGDSPSPKAEMAGKELKA